MSRSLFDIKDKVIVITGATGVLGGVMTKGLAARGAKLVLIGRNEDKFKTLIDEAKTSSWDIQTYAGNVLDQNRMNQICQEAVSAFGKIDILINAAGGNMPGGIIGPDQNILDLDVDGTRQTMDLNYMGSVIPTQAFLEPMIKSGNGNVINISSMSAQQPLTRVMGYSSSKAAIDNYTKWLAVELASKYGEGFRVNAIAPGFFLTQQNKTLLTNNDGSLTDRGEQIVEHTPYKRFGDPEELVGTLIWLCSDASKFVTGTIIPVDGGFSAYSGV